jgi:hypothetical protein
MSHYIVLRIALMVAAVLLFLYAALGPWAKQ